MFFVIVKAVTNMTTDRTPKATEPKTSPFMPSQCILVCKRFSTFRTEKLRIHLQITQVGMPHLVLANTFCCVSEPQRGRG